MMNELHRREERFLLSLKTVEHLYPLLKEYGFKEIIYEQKRVLTVYFGNNNGTFIGPGIGCKYRLYGAEECWTSGKPTTNLLSVPIGVSGIMEIKYTPTRYVHQCERKKIRIENVTLGSTMDSFREGGLKLFLSKNGHKIPEYCWGDGKKLDCTKPLRPVAATSYCRRHFYDGSTRITIDYDTAYYGIDTAYNIPYACRFPTKSPAVKMEIKYISTEKPEVLKLIQEVTFCKQTDSSYIILQELFGLYGLAKYKHPDDDKGFPPLSACIFAKPIGQLKYLRNKKPLTNFISTFSQGIFPNHQDRRGIKY